MQIASILSDLTSLRACDHPAALALVSVYKDGKEENDADVENDEDIHRVTDLLDLHYSVKMKHKQSDDQGLKQARLEVDQVLRELGDKSQAHG